MVGKDDNVKTYNLPKSNLIQEAPYFKKACLEACLEGQTKTVKLEEEDPISFDLIVQWMYCRHVVMPDQDHLSTPLTASDQVLVYLKFLKLADCLGVADPVSKVLSAMILMLKDNPDALMPAHI